MVGPCPPIANGIRPVLVQISEEDSREECEGCRGWMSGGRAGMASSETGIAKSYSDVVKEPRMRARLLAFKVIQCSF